jgi:ribulose-bisphosphate carboxylase large chain
MNETNDRPSACDWVPDDARTGEGASCDWAGVAPQGKDNCSVCHPFRPDFRWEGIPEERYKTETGGWVDIARQVLIGNRGESAAFDLRYFEIAAGGHSSLEKHRHEQVVIGVRGHGRALLGGLVQEVGFLDVLYIAPEDPHQLSNPYLEPFGFFCIVNHDRDRPRPLEPAELEHLQRSPAGSGIRE